MKKIINRPENVVREMLLGMAATNSGLALLANENVLIRADAALVRDLGVAVISGGGSGHEPAHGGYVGAGMLSAAVAGEVFTSPSPDAVFAAIHAVAGKPGVLLIVKNYTGDRLNFGLAMEMARAEGIASEMVVVADDVALAGTEGYAGARGIAGTVLVHKVAGAAVAEGGELRNVAAAARGAAEAVVTMGVALSAGIVPAAGKPSFILADDEMELGLGIHGEPGVRRVPLQNADDLASELVAALIAARHFKPGERVVALINNLGATTEMELAVFAYGALRELERRGLSIERVYSGTFMTSLEAAGVSLSILQVDDERLRLLDAPTSAAAWPRSAAGRVTPIRERLVAGRAIEPVPHRDVPYTGPNLMQRAVGQACRAVREAERQLTDLDREVGDGDLGMSLARGAKALEDILPFFAVQSPAEGLKSIGSVLRNVVGGSSGALYGAFFLRAGTELQLLNATNARSWLTAFQEGCRAISNIGDARAGDRTMLDALLPFGDSLDRALREKRTSKESLAAAVEGAERGAEATSNMLPRRGRSSYLGQRVIGHPDPGAVAAAIWLRAVAAEISN
jgi:dihydroxyacetone kinase